MDLDISDILADVSRAQSSSRFSNQQHSHQQPYDLTSSAYTDHQLLVRAWTSERSCPSLLPYPSALIDRVMTRIREQITRIEDLSSGIDVSFSPNSGTSAHAHTLGSTGRNTNLVLSILQTDLSRTQFILRSFLRQRLAKITKYAAWYLKHLNDLSSTSSTDASSSTSTANSLISPAETKFLLTHQALLSEFYDHSFLSSFPANLRRLDDSAGGVNMVEGPDGGVGVVVRCLSEGWDNITQVAQGDSDGHGSADSTAEDNMRADVELRMRRGEVWVVRWRDVRDGVVKGSLELL